MTTRAQLFFALAPRHLNESQLRELFNQVPEVEVEDIVVFRSYARAVMTKGCGLVTLQNHTQAVKVMQTMNNVYVAGPENPALVIRWAKVRADPTADAVDPVVEECEEEAEYLAMMQPDSSTPAVILSSEAPPPGCDPDAIKLYIGNIPVTYDERSLRPLFRVHGDVVELSIMRNRNDGVSQGYGFVWMQRRQDAEAALKCMNLTHCLTDATGVQKGPLLVRYARPPVQKAPKPPKKRTSRLRRPLHGPGNTMSASPSSGGGGGGHLHHHHHQVVTNEWAGHPHGARLIGQTGSNAGSQHANHSGVAAGQGYSLPAASRAGNNGYASASDMHALQGLQLAQKQQQQSMLQHPQGLLQHAQQIQGTQASGTGMNGQPGSGMVNLSGSSTQNQHVYSPHEYVNTNNIMALAYQALQQQQQQQHGQTGGHAAYTDQPNVQDLYTQQQAHQQAEFNASMRSAQALPVLANHHGISAQEMQQAVGGVQQQNLADLIAQFQRLKTQQQQHQHLQHFQQNHYLG